VTLFEHEPTPFDWSDAHLAALSQLRERVGPDVLTADFHQGTKVLRAGSFVGVVRIGDRTVELLPKLFRSPTPDAASAAKTVLAMMAEALKVKLHPLDDAAVNTGRLDWFEALTRTLAEGLVAEWRRGPARGYEHAEDDLTAVRGRIRVRDHIARPARQHVIPVAYDEFTSDIKLNRVFRFVVERLRERTRDPHNRRLLGHLRDRMGEVTLVPSLPLAAAPMSLVTRLTRRFAPALTLCRLFLAHMVFLPAAGPLAGFAFVIDMNRLFEGFLLAFLARHRGDILPPTLAGCEFLPQTAGAVQALASREGGEPVFRLKPDLAFRSAGLFRALADAKYKRLDPTADDAGVVRGDFYQAAVYAQRYAAPRVLLLYPQLTATPVRARFQLDNGHRIEAATVELRHGLWTPAGGQQLRDELRDIFKETTDGN
jgi:5-methylcytosine-specific restriction enzyme subunit McrC